MSDEPVFDIGVVDSDPTPDRDLQRPHRSERSARRSDHRRDKRNGLAVGAAAILVAIGAIVAVPLLTRAEEPAEQSPEADEAEAPDDRAGSAGGLADPASEAGGGTPFDPPSAAHLRADDVASLFAGTVDTERVHYGIAYVADGDFTILDRRGVMVPEPKMAQDFATVSTLALLTSGGRTWAIDPTDRERSYLVSNTYIVVGSERPGTIAIINPDNPIAIGLMSAGLPVPSVELPAGAALLWVQGRGLLVVPRTGGTFEVRGTASSLARISRARAVAASLTATLYEQCDETLTCSFFVEANGDVWPDLPLRAGSSFSLSPDGRWLVAMAADETSTLLTVDTAEERLLTPGPVTAIGWAPDSAFVVMIRGDELEIVYPSTGEVVAMALNTRPDDRALLVFSS